ncbi:MAG: hypothetical protein RBT42_13560 [Aquabacterium sp.]|jgi:hypothetical protein|uniref:hypothetical protein n=1 Tax=Aquabacterium sp. TaxID=1872578 RepID=UPI002A35C3F0|nr:hypothetical protein [Aquabacterium sp.]MDX9844768.1 hypothetical protein [Aquabacterium sp.]
MTAAPAPHDRCIAGVARIETCLDALDAALASGEANRIEAQAQDLQRALSEGLTVFQQAAPDALTPDLRQRLQAAQARSQSQLQAVHRVLASTGRALGALFPQDGNDTYGALGQSPAARAVGKAYR